ncbi:hypothetical protein AWZ03_004299 [Drosophila navojoa]|uniref:Uncharacterized protein n=1 Tax=Drosophila navojoa TaxID=7232 RepID=A0A484BME4_DRONA|nr:cytochrome c oxidase subunit 7A2, mitochondrial [Drosophila navojoa]TDG49210.1 hypothetical protein AWZ03_004299 [Drosophila navojoa]
MQRNLASKLRPLLRQINGRYSIVTPLVSCRPIEMSPVKMSERTGAKITPKMAKLQKQYQEDNGKPVFLKGGVMDNVLFMSTLVLCVVGLVGDFILWFSYILA